MNYARIYAEFISDRLTKQPEKPDYFEKHHILPRCLGGGDAKSNIIRLTPEDHLFAHIVLAKIHGGRLWASVQAMCRLVTSAADHRKGIRDRVKFGYIRRSLAKYYRSILSGPNGKIADQTKHTLHHFDGRVFSGNRFELADHIGVSRQRVSAVICGSIKNLKGWYSKTHNPDGITGIEFKSIGLRDNNLITLFGKNNTTWTGLKVEFARQFGTKLHFNHENGGCLGWYKTKEYADSSDKRFLDRMKSNSAVRGSMSGSKNYNADKNLYEWKVVDTGEIISATKCEIKEMFGINSARICGLFTGVIKKSKGISLANPVEIQPQ